MRLSVEFAILTGDRSGDARKATWAEIEDNTSTILGERTETGKPFCVNTLGKAVRSADIPAIVPGMRANLRDWFVANGGSYEPAETYWRTNPALLSPIGVKTCSKHGTPSWNAELATSRAALGKELARTRLDLFVGIQLCE